MAVRIGELYALLKVDDKQFQKGLRDAKIGLNEAERAARELAVTLSRRLGRAIAAVGLSKLAKDVISVGIAFNNLAQKASIGFETMLGGADEARRFIADLREFAAETPFEFEGLITSAQMMLAFGTAADDVLPRLRAVGDAAAAIGAGAEGIERVTRALGQMQAKGVISAEEMLQLAEAGIPAWEILAEKIGVDIPTAMDMVSRRAVSAQQGIAMLVQGIEERFGGMMERQARTFEGLRARIVDEMQQAAAQGVEPLFASLQSNMQWVIDNMPFFSESIQIALGGISSVASAVLDIIRETVEAIQDVILWLEPAARWFEENETIQRMTDWGFFPLPARAAPIILRLAEAIRQSRTQAETEAEHVGRAAATAFTEAFVEVAASGPSEAFLRWQEEVERLQRTFDLDIRRTFILREGPFAALDQPQFVRATELEAVINLEREIAALQEAIQLTERRLRDTSLTEQEQQELNDALEAYKVDLIVAGHELTLAREQLRLMQHAQPFEQISREAQLLSLQLQAGVREEDELRARAEELYQRVLALNDGTQTWLRTLLEVKNLLDSLKPEEITPLEQIQRDFGRLQLRVEAGLTPIGDALAELHSLRASLIALASESGGLANATEEQLRLWNALTQAIERLMEAAKPLPDAIAQIEDELKQRLGVGMAVEREIARATGADFDPLAYEMAVLERAIRDMYEATGAITPEMQEWLERLRELGIAIEQRMTQERAAEAAVESLKDALFAGNQAIRQFVDDLAVAVTGKGTPSGMFAQIGTVIAPGIGTAIGAIADVIFAGIRTDAAERASRLLEEAADAIRSAAHEWQGTLAESQFHELLGATPDVSEMEKARDRIRREIEAIQKWGVWPWEQENLRKLQDQLEDINAEINRILQEAPSDVMDRLEEILGVTIRDLQGAVSGAFSASTAEDFAANIESALEGRVRNAFVTAFLESATMAPLFETLGDAIREALLDIDISPDEMKAIRGIMDEIRERSTPLYELLDELGLLAETTEQVNREFARLVNVPLGVRALNALRFAAQTPVMVPTFHGGGVMPYDGLANLRRGEIILTPEQAAAVGGGGGDVHLHFHGPVYGLDDFNRRVEDAAMALQRRDGLRRFGNPVAGRVRR